MNDNKNMILAVVLSAHRAVRLDASLSERYFPTANPPVDQDRGRHARCRRRSRRPSPAADTPARDPRPRASCSRETPRVAIETPRARRLDQPQGRADRRSRPDHRTARRSPTNSPPVRLFSPAGAPGAYFASFGWTGQGVAAARPRHGLDGERHRGSTPGDAGDAELGQRPGPDLRDPARGRRRLSVHRRAARVNRGAGAVAVRPYRAGQPGRRLARSRQLDRPCRADGRVQRRRRLRQRLQRRRRATAQRRFDSRGGWLGFTDKYWLAAVIPDQAQRVEAAFRHSARDRRLSRPISAAAADRRARPAARATSRTCSPAPRRSSCSTPIPTRSARRSSGRSTGAGSAGS